jgi:hypothetical protein
MRITQEERDTWQKMAKNEGITVTELIRRTLGKKRIRRRETPEADPALVRQVAMIGNNLNQIARLANIDHALSLRIMIQLRIISESTKALLR